MALLEIHNLHVFYGKIHALHGVSLEVGANEIVTLIGANGAGKTTTLNAISGILAAEQGQVRFDGQSLERTQCRTKWSAEAWSRCQKGGAFSAD